MTTQPLSMKRVYHLALSEKELKGAKYAFLPGDPDRVPVIAQAFDKKAYEIAFHREFRTFLGRIGNESVIVTSTGIGGPSTAIAVEELAQLGVRTFIRVGTTGAIQEYIKLADVIITSGAVRLDGASLHYAPLAYPAVADYQVLHALVEAAKALSATGRRHRHISQAAAFQYHIGITASADTFYPGQERYDTYSGYVIRELQGSLKEWQRLNVLNYEMEAATLFTMASALGLRAGCVSGVLVNRTKEEHVTPVIVKEAEENAIEVATKAMEMLISKTLDV